MEVKAVSKCDVVVVGAGPYGLSAAAFLKPLKGLDVCVLGEPMSFWQCHMPKGMLLRSPRTASDLVDPDNRLTLSDYQKATGRPLRNKAPEIITDAFAKKAYEKQVPLSDFIEYGHWFRKQAGIDVDRRKVMQIERNGEGFHLHMEDGQALHARRVVLATGINDFSNRPEVFKNLPSGLVSHTSEHRDLDKFRGKEVFMIGAGQSALETAVLLYEAGAQVEVLVREKAVRWLGVSRRWMKRGLLGKTLYGKGDVGPAVLSQIVQRPNLFRLLPRGIQNTAGPRAIRAAVSSWVWGRTQHVPIHTSRFVVSAEPNGDRLRVRLNDGTERTVDHIMLGTGYKIDIARYPFFSEPILERIQRVNGYPVLNEGYESVSLPGLHFVGATAMWSFGPLMRFVAGAEFACRSLEQGIRRSAR